MSNVVSGLFLLPRPLNCGIAALSVLVGGITAGALWPTPGLIAAAVAAASIGGAGNAFNDLRDLEIDRINRPNRPLPAGMLSQDLAKAEAILLAVAGLVISWLLGPATGMIATCTLLLLLLYSRFLKTTTLWGNLAVALAAAAAFPYGAIAYGTLGRSWIPAGFALLFHLGREIVKDLEDVIGDGSVGARTIPLRWGPSVATWTSISIFLILMILTLIPWILDIYGTAYLAVVTPMNLVVLGLHYRLWLAGVCGRPDAKAAWSPILKGCMLLGLMAVVVGELL